jgi:integrase
VPISPRVRQALLARYSEQKEGWIFLSKRAGGGHLTTVAKQFEKARKEAGCQKTSSSTARAMALELRCIGRPKNLFAVMNVMGHTTVSTTMKYSTKISMRWPPWPAIGSSKDAKRTQSVGPGSSRSCQVLEKMVSAVGIEPTTY